MTAHNGTTLDAAAAPTSQPAKAKAALRRRFFVDDMPDKGLFVIVAMFGFGTIVAAKLNGFNPYFVGFGAVALMILYGVVAYRIPLVRLRVDRLGDNFYYLGFIYTLASLSAALLQLQNEEAQFDALLGSFGIALLTTVVGIAGRVMFVQMRSEIDQVEAEARRDLLTASQELRAQLALTLRDFKVLQVGLQQAAAEILDDKQIKRVVAAADEAANGIRDAFAANVKHAQAAHEANIVHTNSVRESVAGTAAAIQQLLSKINAMDLPSKELEDQMRELTAEIDAMLERVRLVLQERTRRKRGRWFGLAAR